MSFIKINNKFLKKIIIINIINSLTHLFLFLLIFINNLSYLFNY